MDLLDFAMAFILGYLIRSVIGLALIIADNKNYTIIANRAANIIRGKKK